VISIAGLWPCNSGTAKRRRCNTLYFTAGIANADNIEDHGLFGSIRIASASSNPAPAIPVQIDRLRFTPVTLEVALGAQVT